MSDDDLVIRSAEANLACVKLERNLSAAKEAGEVDADLKLKLRDARRVARELRDKLKPEPGPGDAVVNPSVISASAEVQK